MSVAVCTVTPTLPQSLSWTADDAADFCWDKKDRASLISRSERVREFVKNEAAAVIIATSWCGQGYGVAKSTEEDDVISSGAHLFSPPPSLLAYVRTCVCVCVFVNVCACRHVWERSPSCLCFSQSNKKQNEYLMRSSVASLCCVRSLSRPGSLSWS